MVASAQLVGSITVAGHLPHIMPVVVSPRLMKDQDLHHYHQYESHAALVINHRILYVCYAANICTGYC